MTRCEHCDCLIFSLDDGIWWQDEHGHTVCPHSVTTKHEPIVHMDIEY